MSVKVGVDVFTEKASGCLNVRCSHSVITSPSAPADSGYRSISSNIVHRAVCAASCAGELLPPNTIQPPTKVLCSTVFAPSPKRPRRTTRSTFSRTCAHAFTCGVSRFFDQCDALLSVGKQITTVPGFWSIIQHNPPSRIDDLPNACDANISVNEFTSGSAKQSSGST